MLNFLQSRLIFYNLTISISYPKISVHRCLFIKVVREEKAKLPACRVGANKGAETGVGADWLPSFGSVWSKQSRTHHR